ncbi:chitinase C-terminal domain-containing protein [Sinosporangium siamense]|uniref:Chitinase n=1 Tax=Sinosporangium siamense TaxID=1367973 RepID=A0A919V6D4_9ACTN|nr:glycosyl hydrolase family 18 protein [Sinosporangium siamense]GII91891.1 chitinase [Sinosporangium siamense]
MSEALATHPPRRSRVRAALTAAGASLALIAGVLVSSAAAAVDNETCRPDGLYKTPGVDVPYCINYDDAGREKLGANHKRRIIGYFTSWRTGKNGQPSYLVKDIPWAKISHINYAFAGVGADHKITIGANNADNAATGLEWPGVAGAEMDPAYTYKGHFNLLNKFKKQNPHAKTMISVGGWAESGGILDGDIRKSEGGFYRLTVNNDNSINQAGINTFADSAVEFIRKYGFNGVDIDYEYPSSMKDSGHPGDWAHANTRRAVLMKGYAALMKTLREKLDRAAAADNKYYMLTIAAPSSAYLLRGMETFQVTQYLDYVDIMSYDLHGAWNQFVGPQAALFDDGKDGELARWNVYNQANYGGLGYLNTDWAYRYFRGAMQSGRINIGVPYYSRGWKNVTGGTNGLWGQSPVVRPPTCGQGLAECGDGARGIDNIWHDIENGQEMGAGFNPMWHAKNLEKGILGSYLPSMGLRPDTDPEDKLTGTYTRHYDATLVAPWLWNNEKKVFLSTEDEQSLGAKADYVNNNGIGGIMIWELAGDYEWNATKGEYTMGNTLTNLLFDKFKTATAYGATKAKVTIPAEKLDVSIEAHSFPTGDNNYPINPKLKITNNSRTTIPGGAEFQWDYGTSAPGTAKDQSGWGMRVINSEHTAANNIGGIKGDFHRVSVKSPADKPIAPGGTAELDYVYQLPKAGLTNITLTFGGKTYGLVQDYARGGVVVEPTASPTDRPTGSCTSPDWDRTKVYASPTKVAHNGKEWQNQWWTQGEEPGVAGVWKELGPCAGGTSSPSPSPSGTSSPSPSPSGTSSPSPSPTGTASPSPSPTGTCASPAWDRSKVYATTTKVSHNGKEWQNQWWTQGEEPGVAGVWKELGPC